MAAQSAMFGGQFVLSCGPGLLARMKLKTIRSRGLTGAPDDFRAAKYR
jgi:hypothetical protein